MRQLNYIQEWRHWTYACGNQTMFNQLTLTCAFIDEAIPCRHAPQFQYLNEVIHRPKEPFLTDADVTSGFSYYSNRIMSDGARARAFEDSQLMAQIGGHTTASTGVPQQPQQQVIKPKIVAVQAPQAPQPLNEPERRQQWSQSANQNQNQQPGWFIANSRLGDQPTAHPETVANNLFEPFFANQQQHQQQQPQQQAPQQQLQQQQATSNRIIENRLLKINHINNNALAAGNFVDAFANQPATTTQFQTNSASAVAPQTAPSARQPLLRTQRQPQQRQQPVRQQLQHHPSTTARPAATTFAAPLIAAATNDQHQSEQSAPSTSGVSLPASSRAQVDLSDSHGGTNNQAPQSFEFTLTTDHRLGSSNVHHSQLHFQQPTVMSHGSPGAARSGNLFASNPLRSSLGNGQRVMLPPPPPTTTQSGLEEITTTDPTTPSPTTETVATTSQQGVQLVPTDATTTAALERAQPAATTTTTTTTTAPTTTTAQPTTTTTTGAPVTTISSSSARQTRRRQQQHTGASGHMAAARWQSTRLTGAAAAAARQARQSRPDNGEPLVMRRQAIQFPVRSVSPQTNNGTEQVTSSSSLRSSSSSSSTTMQVWRASLVEPPARFESLITRRRV